MCRCLAASYLSLLLYLLYLFLQLLQFIFFLLLRLEKFRVEFFLLLESLDCIFEDADLTKDLFVDLVSFCLLLLKFSHLCWLIASFGRYIFFAILQEIHLGFQTPNGLIFSNHPVFQISKFLLKHAMIFFYLDKFFLSALPQFPFIVKGSVGIIQLFL